MPEKDKAGQPDANQYMTLVVASSGAVVARLASSPEAFAPKGRE
jgi:hypothetical protein